ncbi:UvrABC system protein A [Geodia barretti]|uniref:UvrABC system protein A n=1 Tax=Geodia barretti TaxID=519541 RepID=A0AA35QR91_GEOBA|nr:UvrABC system protein A [Geodia barretti]
MVDDLLKLPSGTRIQVLAPLPCTDPTEFQQQIETVIRAGFVRIKVDGEVLELADWAGSASPGGADLAGSASLGRADLAGSASLARADLVVDRLAMRDGVAKRLADSIEVALKHGDEVVKIDAHDAPATESRRYTQRSACLECGAPFPQTVPQLFSFNSPHGACPSCNGLGVRPPGRSRGGAAPADASPRPCPKCAGARLRSESLQVRISGMDIGQVSALSLNDFSGFIEDVALGDRETAVAGNILREIRERTDTLLELELGYLSLGRSSDSLSGGECQRIRLAAHIGARLSGVIYVLDEPTDAGNTVLVVEHDRDVIMAADHVIDMGPGAGAAGGEVVLAAGSVDHVRRSPASRTGPYLADAGPPGSRARRTASGTLSLRKVRRHNLKNIDVDFPIGLMTCVTGVSGSGKSSLVGKAGRTERRGLRPVSGLDVFDRVLHVDQGSIGRSGRSTPATYGGLFDPLRNLFARLPEARMRGYGPGRFSYNAAGGRCEACLGAGTVEIEMQFLPDVSVGCDVCGGRRYNRETLEIQYKGASIADVLDLTVTEALDFLGNVPLVRRRLDSMWQVGLGYLRLGQPATTLSGGEAQRVKLARELGKNSAGKVLYLFDEPTTGLHFEEVDRLVEILDRLVESGHTVIAIEHNPDFLRCADYIVDLGPEAARTAGTWWPRAPPKRSWRWPDPPTVSTA